MKSKTHNLMIAVFLSSAVLLTAIGARGQEPTTMYSITDLGTLGTGSNSIPNWVTNSGDVVGFSETGQTNGFGFPIHHAFRWRKGVMKDLGTLGGDFSGASGANEEGRVVGSANVTGNATSHAFLWDQGSMSDLGTLVGPAGFSFGSLINGQGEVVGYSDSSDGNQHAVVWRDGVIADLNTLGGPNSFGFGINDRGQMTGGSQANNVIDPVVGFPLFHPVLWDKGAIMDLGPGLDGLGAVAFNINNRTEIVGRFAAPVPDPNVVRVAHAFLWESGLMYDLGVPADEQDSEALSLNDRGLIVGDSGMGFVETYGPDRALLWRLGDSAGEASAPIDLNTLIPPNSGYQLIQAVDVNDRGEIAVIAFQFSTGNVHAALLTPQSSTSLANAASALPHVAPNLSWNARRLLDHARRAREGRK
jgi:probable HAF family extracellular repeat protein